MPDSPTNFDRLRPRKERLKAFGFVQAAQGYEWRGILPKTRLEITVRVNKSGQVSAELRDPQSGGTYILHRVAGASGKFVGQVRREYEDILGRIAASCFEKDVFKSRQAKELIAYAREKYGDELEFLWKQFPGNAVLRRKDTGKWYAALLVLAPEKLGLPAGDLVNILDVRTPPGEAETLADGRRYFPGYHMNKKHWLTILLDGQVPSREIFRHIDQSYTLAVK